MRLCDTLMELTAACKTIFFTVVSAAALAAARSAAPHLCPQHVYIDLNSTSPQVKQEIGRIIERSGARFVEGR